MAACSLVFSFHLSAHIGFDFWLDSIYILDKTAYVFSCVHVVALVYRLCDVFAINFGWTILCHLGCGVLKRAKTIVTVVHAGCRLSYNRTAQQDTHARRSWNKFKLRHGLDNKRRALFKHIFSPVLFFNTEYTCVCGLTVSQTPEKIQSA